MATTDEPPIVVTGVTGAIGGAVARELAARRVRQRLVVRGDADRAPALDGAEVVVASYDDDTALRHAFAGARTALFVAAPEGEHRLDRHRTVAAALADAGVARVVYTSFVGASPYATFTLARDHHHTEAALRSLGMAVTALRDSLYAELLPSFFGDDGVLRGPGGDGRLAPVARGDVAAVAVAALLDEGLDGRDLQLTGPELLTLHEVAARVGEATGRELRYVPQSEPEAYDARRTGWPDAHAWQLDAWVSTYTAIADGSMAVASDDVREVLGRAPTALEDALAGG